MTKLLEMLKGKKTFGIALISIVYALVMHYGNNSIDTNTMIEMILASCGAVGLRDAIK